MVAFLWEKGRVRCLVIRLCMQIHVSAYESVPGFEIKTENKVILT